MRLQGQDYGSVQYLSSLLNAHPVAFEGNVLNLLLLQNAERIACARDYLRSLDAPVLAEEKREYLVGAADGWPFPVIHIPQRPDPWEVSDALFRDFARAASILRRQADIGALIAEMADPSEVDVVALLVVDGLSYYDLPTEVQAEPCLVDGVTITQFGYRQVIGRPSVSQRLFARGYRTQVGLTYFDADTNSLAADLFDSFGDSQVCRISTFDEGLDLLSAQPLLRGYVQITAPGLDGLCHNHRDRPPREVYLQRILGWFDTLVDRLKVNGRRVLACLTSDHGILWREEIEDRRQVVSGVMSGDSTHPRYIPGSLLREYTLIRRSGAQAYSLLRAPYLTRDLRRTEWGVHGGVSAWESIVPLIIRKS